MSPCLPLHFWDWFDTVWIVPVTTGITYIFFGFHKYAIVCLKSILVHVYFAPTQTFHRIAMPISLFLYQSGLNDVLLLQYYDTAPWNPIAISPYCFPLKWVAAIDTTSQLIPIFLRTQMSMYYSRSIAMLYLVLPMCQRVVSTCNGTCWFFSYISCTMAIQPVFQCQSVCQCVKLHCCWRAQWRASTPSFKCPWHI